MTYPQEIGMIIGLFALSAMGQNRTSTVAATMSTIGWKADMQNHAREVRN